MKRITAILLSLALLLSLVACGEQTSPAEMQGNDVNRSEKSASSNDDTKESFTSANNPKDTMEPSAPIDGSKDTTEPSDPADNPKDTTESFAPVTEPTDFSFDVNLDGVTTLEELEVRIDEHLANAIESLSFRWKTLSTEIDTYEKYCDNLKMVSAFYQTVVAETEKMCIMLYEYSAVYARMILDSDMSADDKYNTIDGINNCLYDDACDEIHDEIYEGILDEMYDYFYDGILDDAKNAVNYSDWYDVCSNEYSQWHDISSEVYSLYYDTASDIYSFYYNMSSKLYSRDFDRAEKLYKRFIKKIAKARGLNNSDSVSNAIFDTTIRSASNIEELEDIVDAHVSECVQALIMEWKALSTNIDTFDKYTKNVDVIKEFYTHIEDSASRIFVMICEYGASYAKLILQSGSSAEDKYKDFEDFKDCIYEDACEIVKDEIYEELLNEIQDYYYKGIINDAKDNIPYREWSDARGDAYGWWSDARGEVYSDWSDTRGDLYSFYSDIRSELYSRDFDRAEKIYGKFLEKIAKAKGLNIDDSISDETFDITIRSTSNIEELESVVDAHVSECVQALITEWKALSADIDTFDKYTKNVDAIEEFHTHIEDSASQILVMICEYGVSYAELILQSGSSAKDKYKNFENFKDCIYEDACEIVKDEIYEDLLNEIKDYYYEGIINDAKDNISYREWSDARGDAYGWWSDARGEVYSDWSDTRGDLYSFYSDMRSELYSGDSNGANNELQDFKDKVAKMK